MTSIALTPAQFVSAARLAKAYGHMWGRYAPECLNGANYANALDAAIAALRVAREGGGFRRLCLEEAAKAAVAASGGDPDKISAAVTAAETAINDPDWWGITAPSTEHTTCSGRTHWTILPSGEVRGEIRVPARIGEWGHVQEWTVALRVERGRIVWVRPDLVDLRQLAGAAALLDAATGRPHLPGWQWFGPAVAGCTSHADLIRLRKQADWVQKTQCYPATPERASFARGDGLLGRDDQSAFDAL